MSTIRIQHPPPSGGGNPAQFYELAANKTVPGHQAGILLVSGETFEATAADMLVTIDWAATVLGGSKCALTFHCGKVTPNGARVSQDLVDRSGPVIQQGPLPGVTDYHELLFPVAIDAESVPGVGHCTFLLTGLDVGETYTWEMKWGMLAGAKVLSTNGAVPFRIAVDDVGMRAIVTHASFNTVRIFTLGTWQFWQAAPGYYEYGAFGQIVPAGYEPTASKWAMTPVADTNIGGSSIGAAFAKQTAGRRFLIGNTSDNKLYLINPITGAVIVSQAAAFAADPWDLQFFPGTNPTQAVVATDDNNLRVMNVSDASIAQALAINVGVSGRATAANFRSGANVGLWHGSRGVNPIRLRMYDTAGGIQNGASGIQLEAALGDVRRIRRIPNGPNAETMLVATSRGKVYHVSADGLTVLGSWTHPDGVVDLADLAVSPNGVLCYVIDAAAAPNAQLHYFWLPNTVGGPAYQHFDSSGLGGGVTGLAIAITNDAAFGTEDVIYAHTGNVLTNLPGGYGYCRPANLINAEHLRVIFSDA